MTLPPGAGSHVRNRAFRDRSRGVFRTVRTAPASDRVRAWRSRHRAAPSSRRGTPRRAGRSSERRGLSPAWRRGWSDCRAGAQDLRPATSPLQGIAMPADRRRTRLRHPEFSGSRARRTGDSARHGPAGPPDRRSVPACTRRARRYSLRSVRRRRTTRRRRPVYRHGWPRKSDRGNRRPQAAHSETRGYPPPRRQRLLPARRSAGPRTRSRRAARNPRRPGCRLHGLPAARRPHARTGRGQNRRTPSCL